MAAQVSGQGENSAMLPSRVHFPSPRLATVVLAVQAAVLALACTADDNPAADDPSMQSWDAGSPGVAAGGAATMGGAGATFGGPGGMGVTLSPTTTPDAGVVPPVSPGSTGGTTGAGGTSGGLVGGSGFLGGLAGLTGGTGFIGGLTGGGTASAGGGNAAPPPGAPPGPDDGDPSQPVVAVPGVACGPNPSLFGLTSTNVVIGGRNVHVAYPCNKRKGAPMTFILNLHGTMPLEELKLYQVAYFAANNFVNSHNLITVAPISAGSQWGNDDGGVDLPHLKQVIDWVYTTFKDFDIRSMWIGGHSWGAMFTTTYACGAELSDKVRGVILMSTFPTMPACASRISVINTNAENDLAGPLPQGNIPMQHGCGAEMKSMLGNNEQTLWPNCEKGYVHSNYLMFGKAHADYMDEVVVKSIVDLIKSARP
jgi:pimeloyl-ACP methyl ester carboxylesterase